MKPVNSSGRAESVPVAPAVARRVAVQLEPVDVGVGRRGKRHSDEHRGDTDKNGDCEQAPEVADLPHLGCLPSALN